MQLEEILDKLGVEYKEIEHEADYPASKPGHQAELFLVDERKRLFLEKSEKGGYRLPRKNMGEKEMENISEYVENLPEVDNLRRPLKVRESNDGNFSVVFLCDPRDIGLDGYWFEEVPKAARDQDFVKRTLYQLDPDLVFSDINESLEGVEERLFTGGRMKHIYFVTGESGKRYAIYFYIPRTILRMENISERIDREIHFYQKMKDAEGLHAPEVVRTDGKNYLVASHLEGENLGMQLEKNPERAGNFAGKLGEALSSIHSIQFEEFGELDREGLKKSFESWKDFIQSSLDEIEDRAGEFELVEKGLEKLRFEIEILEDDSEPVLCHGDLHPWNAMVDEDGEIGIHDCEGSLSGCRIFDISYTISTWAEESEVTEEFLEGYGRQKLGERWREKLEYYRLFHAVTGLASAKLIDDPKLKETKQENLKSILQSYGK